MDTLINIAIVVLLVVEIGVFCFFEHKLWKTFYTPLNFLMLPFIIIFILTIPISKNFGFVDIYYPSLLLWIIGLPFFFIPSFVLGTLSQKIQFQRSIKIEKPINLTLFFWISVFFLALFFFRLLFMGTTDGSRAGSDEYASQFSSFGLFGHILVMLITLQIFFIIFISKKRWFDVFIIFGVIFLTVINQVKSWVLIPFIAGLIGRLISGRMHFRIRKVLLFAVSGFVIFFLSYYLMMMVANEIEYFNDIYDFYDFVIVHFFHYLSSGVLGLSMDAEMGFVEHHDWSVIFAPFYNMYNLLTNNPPVSQVNEFYFDSGHALTNIRTYFGTLYVYGGGVFMAVYSLILSTIAYTVRLFSMKQNSVFMFSLDGWICALLFMGWFEFYFHSLTTFEIPFWILLFFIINKLSLIKHKNVKS